MKVIEELLRRRWILKSKDPKLYYAVRDELPNIRKFINEKLGCTVIENPMLIKLEKIPSIPLPFMGIKSFDSPIEYAYLCIVLMFLEDRDASSQFILSQLTEYMSTALPGDITDWTRYVNRRMLIKTLKFAVDCGLLNISDGSTDAFMDSEHGEILYENTGVSRYFMRVFPKDIMTFQYPSDFENSDWFEGDEERGIARRHRVYKRLLFTPALLRAQGLEEDYEYIKNYKFRLEEEFAGMFDAHLDVYKGAAFLFETEESHMGDVFPDESGLSDVILLFSTMVQKMVNQGEWKAYHDDTIAVDDIEFLQLIRKCRKQYGKGFSKTLRELSDHEFEEALIQRMVYMQLIQSDLKHHLWILYPSFGLYGGHYPYDYDQTDPIKSTTISKPLTKERRSAHDKHNKQVAKQSLWSD